MLGANLLDLEEEISRDLFLTKVIRYQVKIYLLMKTQGHLTYDSNDFYLTGSRRNYKNFL